MTSGPETELLNAFCHAVVFHKNPSPLLMPRIDRGVKNILVFFRLLYAVIKSLSDVTCWLLNYNKRLLCKVNPKRHFPRIKRLFMKACARQKHREQKAGRCQHFWRGPVTRTLSSGLCVTCSLSNMAASGELNVHLRSVRILKETQKAIYFSMRFCFREITIYCLQMIISGALVEKRHRRSVAQANGVLANAGSQPAS